MGRHSKPAAASLDPQRRDRGWLLTSALLGVFLVTVVAALSYSADLGEGDAVLRTARAVAGFVLVMGALGLLVNGGYALLDWATTRSRTDQDVETFTGVDGHYMPEVFWRRLLPLWTGLAALGSLASITVMLLDG